MASRGRLESRGRSGTVAAQRRIRKAVGGERTLITQAATFLQSNTYALANRCSVRLKKLC